MCGITGAIALDSSLNVNYLKNMCDAISHRGKNGSGFFLAHSGTGNKHNADYFQSYTEEKFKHNNPMIPTIDSDFGKSSLHEKQWDIYLAHRRLSILDLSIKGHQPMSNLAQNVWISYNGEIYNFKEIRDELTLKGYKFQSSSDTEVVLVSYEEWGIDCIKKFNGMFAFSIWDNRKKQLYLARDRYGIKPLYYRFIPNKILLFGSEAKAISEYKEFRNTLNQKAMLEYFTFQNIFTNQTLYDDVHILEAGHYLSFDMSIPGVLKKTKYWDYDFTETTIEKTEKQWFDELNGLFEQSVQRQMVSDVEIGSYLSGGIDSGSITSIASKRTPNLKTFTVGFDLNRISGLELAYDERERSEYISAVLKTEQYEMVLKSGDMERCLPEFSYHLEEPRVGQSYPNFYASKLASKFVKVVLSGTGGDELFGGYPWRYYRAVNSSNFEDYIDNYYQFWQRLIPNKDLKNVFAPIWKDVSDVWTRDIFKSVFDYPVSNISSPEEYVNHSLYFEAKTFLHGLLVVEDKLSMAHTLETRVPFLDNDLVDFAMKLPVKHKLGKLGEITRLNENELGKLKKYYQKTHDGKLLFRKAMYNHLPDNILNDVKKGFSAPDSSWFKGESMDYVIRKLMNPNAKLYNYMDQKIVQKMIESHLTGIENKRLLIWSLLNTEEWLTQNQF